MPPKKAITQEEAIERINKWMVDNVSHSTTTGTFIPTNKKEWNQCLLNKKLNNVDEAATLAAEIFKLLQYSRAVLDTYASTNNDLLNQIADQRSEISNQRSEFKQATEEIDQLKTKFIKMETQNDKLQEYSDIYTKMEDGFKAWKYEITGGTATPLYGDENSAINVNDVIEKLTTQVERLEKQNTMVTEDEIFPKLIDEAVAKSQKKWADLFDTNKEEIKRQTTEVKKQTKLVEKSILEQKQKQAVENIERQKRVRNIIINNIPESEDTEKKQSEHDAEIVANLLNIGKDKISSVCRAGIKKTAGENAQPRKLLIMLSSPELAQQLHDYGRGKPILDENNKPKYWVNPDLIKSDRFANFNARQQRRTMQDKRQQATNNTTTTNSQQNFQD